MGAEHDTAKRFARMSNEKPSLRRGTRSDEMPPMKNMSRVLAVPFVALALLAFACGQPKQSEVPDADKEAQGPDMGGEETAAKPVEGDAKPATNEDLRTKCCASCKEGLAADRSGTAPDQIPCADYTSNLSPWCLEFFRANPTKASECK
jgi:hypothetical protein